MNNQLYFNLLKAKRDLSKLVKVRRTVTRKGRTFTQDYYVKPTDVKSTDVVIGNFQNVLPAPGSVPKPAKGVWDKKYFDSITQNKNDRTEALAYLKDLGLTWTHSKNAGIEWMWALNALNVYLGVKQPINRSKQNTPIKQATQQTTSTQPTPTNVANTSNSANSIVLDKATQDDLNKCTNGKEKVATLKQHLGQDKCLEYAKQLGVTWTEDANNRNINIMRMSMALKKYFDTLDGTVSPTGSSTSKDSKPKGKVGAPDGNQNAKKDGVTNEPKKVEIPNDDIEIKDDFTPRQKALAELINKTTDVKDLELFKATGIVAEDDQAKNFIKNSLYKAYYNKSSTGKQRFVSEKTFSENVSKTISPVLKGVPNKTLKKGLMRMLRNSNTATTDALIYTRDVLSSVPGLHSTVGLVAMASYDAPSRYNYYSSQLPGVLIDLDRNFTQMANEDYGNLGYHGDDAKEAKAYFDKFGIEKTGVYSVLTSIAEREPSLADESKSMIQDYKDMVDICGGNIKLLQSMLSGDVDFSTIIQMRNKSKSTALALNKLADEFKSLKSKYNLSDEDIFRTMSNMDKIRYNGELLLVNKDGDYIKDSNGDTIDIYSTVIKPILIPNYVSNNGTGATTISVSQLLRLEQDTWHCKSAGQMICTMIKTGKPCEELTVELVKDTLNTLTSQSILPHSFSSGVYSDLLNIISKPKLYEPITEENYMKLNSKLLHFSGQKLQINRANISGQSNGQEQYEDLDLSKLSAKEFKEYKMDSSRYNPTLRVVSNGEVNPQKDVILSNLLNIRDNATLLSEMSDYIPHDCPESKANNNGLDYSANFKYLKGGYNNKLICNSGDELSPSETNNQIKYQLQNSPFITPEIHKQLQDYAESSGYCEIDYSSEPDADLKTKIKKATSCSYLSESSLEAHKDTPVYDVLMGHFQSVAKYCPQIKNTRVKTDDDVVKFFNTKLGYDDPKTGVKLNTTELNTTKLKVLRQETFKKVHCSLKSADQSQRDSIETRVKHDWDKEKRDPTTGKRLYGYISCKFNGVYQINNSESDEVFQKSVQKITSSKPASIKGNSYETNVVSLFHGTDFRGACGILGVDGKFRAPKNSEDAVKNGQKYAGGMLGPGVYLADLAGKSAGYFGHWGAGYNTRGALLICNAILGDHATSDDYWSVRDRMDVDSVSMRAGGNTGGRVLRADEWCIRSNELVSPQFIVDAEAVRR